MPKQKNRLRSRAATARTPAVAPAGAATELSSSASVQSDRRGAAMEAARKSSLSVAETVAVLTSLFSLIVACGALYLQFFRVKNVVHAAPLEFRFVETTRRAHEIEEFVMVTAFANEGTRDAVIAEAFPIKYATSGSGWARLQGIRAQVHLPLILKPGEIKLLDIRGVWEPEIAYLDSEPIAGSGNRTIRIGLLCSTMRSDGRIFRSDEHVYTITVSPDGRASPSRKLVASYSLFRNETGSVY